MKEIPIVLFTEESKAFLYICPCQTLPWEQESTYIYINI